MRIALVIYHADPSRGGAERYTIDLAAALARAGHSVSLFAMSFDQIPDGVVKVSLDARGWTRSQRLRSFQASMHGKVNQAPYDIVHAMLPVEGGNIYHPHAGLAVAAFPTVKKNIAAIFNPRRLLFARFERRLLKHPDAPIVLCLSEVVRRDVRQWYPKLDDADLPILFNAVDLHRFVPQPKTFDPDRLNLLIVAQDFSRKGLIHVLLAMKKLNDKRLHLTVVGKDKAGPYAYFATHAGMIDRVHFVGPTIDPRPFYQAADVFVLPTSHDPCSLVVLEALAMGVPVITTKINGASEIMTDGQHGYVLDDPKNFNALADRLQRLLDVNERKRMSDACLALRPKLAYERHLETLTSIYQSRLLNVDGGLST